jgi:hypothetical protein
VIKLIVGGVISGEFSNGDNYFQVMCVCVGWDKDRDGENVCVYVCVWVETRTEMEKMCVCMCVCVGRNKGSNREIDRWGGVCVPGQGQKEREKRKKGCVSAQVPFSFAPRPPTPPATTKRTLNNVLDNKLLASSTS